MTISDDEWLNRMRSFGVPEADASFLLGIFAASRNSEFNVADPSLGQLLGHKPTPFREALAATLTS
jgi:NAD(P)H dehydrogenase (quinone)